MENWPSIIHFKVVGGAVSSTIFVAMEGGRVSEGVQSKLPIFLYFLGMTSLFCWQAGNSILKFLDGEVQ